MRGPGGNRLRSFLTGIRGTVQTGSQRVPTPSSAFGTFSRGEKDLRGAIVASAGLLLHYAEECCLEVFNILAPGTYLPSLETSIGKGLLPAFRTAGIDATAREASRSFS